MGWAAQLVAHDSVVGCWMLLRLLDVVGCHWMSLGCCWMLLDIVGCHWMWLDVSKHRWMLVDVGECRDVVGRRWLSLDT